MYLLARLALSETKLVRGSCDSSGSEEREANDQRLNACRVRGVEWRASR